MRWLIMARIFILFCFVGNSSSASGASSLPSPDNSRSMALIGAKIYPSPRAKPIHDGVVLIKDGRIASVGERATITVPADAAVIDCTGLIMTAALWNSHVHFTEPKWQSAEAQSAGQLAEHRRTMLTRYGFARVLDTGSRLRNTLAIRSRIERGDVVGPYIMTTGGGLAPKDGSPFYILPSRLPEIGSPGEAEKRVHERLDDGADAVKLFTARSASIDSPPPPGGRAVCGMAALLGIASRPGFIAPCQQLRRVKSVRPHHPASAPAGTYNDPRAEQPIAAGNRRLTRASNPNEPTREEVQA